jgi:4-hydroxy-tetrahydrodipicolinate reductase
LPATGERITLRHVASDRALVCARGLARGALAAKGRLPGEYSMLDVLGLATAGAR